MKESKAILNKKIKFKVVAILFLLGTLFFNNTSITYAIPVVETGPNLATNLANTVTSLANTVESTASQINTMLTLPQAISTQINTYKSWYKVIYEDIAAFENARKAIKDIQTNTQNWLKTGFKGKPIFLTDPDQFFNNLALDQLALVKSALIKDLGYANRGIAQQLVKDISGEMNPRSDRFASQLGSDICSSMRRELLAYQRISDAAQRLKLVTAKQAQINSVCSGSAEQQYAKAKECAANFNCGGWASVIAITSNSEQNTDLGLKELARTEYEKNLAKETKKRDDELNRGNGAFNEAKCLQFETVENRRICVREEVISPGVAAVSALDQLIKEPVNSLQLVSLKGQDSALSSITGFVGNLLNAASSIRSTINSVNTTVNSVTGSVRAITGAANSVINSVNSVQSQIDNLIAGIDNTSQAPRSGAQIASNAPASDSGAYTISQPDKKELLSLIKPLFDSSINSNRSAAVFANKELTNYQTVANNLDSIAQCYISKAQAQKVLLDRGTIIPASYILRIPDSIPQVIKIRAAAVNSEIVNLKAVLERGRIAQVSATDIYQAMSTTTDSRVFSELKDKLDLSYGDMLNLGFWTIRNLRSESGNSGESNNGLYAQLVAEANDLATNKLATCNATPIIPPLPEYDNISSDR